MKRYEELYNEITIENLKETIKIQEMVISHQKQMIEDLKYKLSEDTNIKIIEAADRLITSQKEYIAFLEKII
ncbi:hypothetical protein [Neisseria subflava]|uniref:hypothetical protein n=1 Tax=Neisseria subflava TaxID=28449 RepID=UPI00202A186F|nr:hypothetical protein [Neisseria subflava]MCL9777676.1 hypothetical protein [Neisseria subflava]